MHSGISHQAAAAAAKRILGFYDTIPAADPQAFAAGVTALLQTYPAAVVERAADPVTGIPKAIQYLNLSAIGKCLDGWHREYIDHQRRLEQPKLPAPAPSDPVEDARMAKQLRDLSDTVKLKTMM